MKHAYFTHRKNLEIFKAAHSWVDKRDIAFNYFEHDAEIVSEEMSSYMNRVGDYIDQLEAENAELKKRLEDKKK